MMGLEFLRRISGILNKTLTASADTVYGAVFDILDEVVDYESATLFAIDQDSEQLSIVQTRGPVVVDLASEVGFDRGSGLSGWTGSRREPVILPSIGAGQPERGFCSLVSVPLWLNNRLVGVLNLGHSQPGFFKTGSREDFAELGLHLTLVIEQLQLRSELREKNMQLESLVTELRQTQSELIEKERLAAIGELVVKVNHEINNPLSAVIGLADLLLLQHQELDPGVLANLEKIRTAAYRIHEVTEALKKIESSAADEYLEGVKMLKLD